MRKTLDRSSSGKLLLLNGRQKLCALLCCVLLSLYACGTASATQQKVIKAHHQTTIGMDISVFIAAYGKPLAGSESEHGYNFSLYEDQTNVAPSYDLSAGVAFSSPAPYTSRVDSIWLSAPNGATWDEGTAIKQCEALAPADAVYEKQGTKSADGTVERIYMSATLAKQFDAPAFYEFHDQKNKLGTFYLTLRANSATDFFACTEQLVGNF